MAWHPSGRARVSARQPAALGICDRCGLQYNLKDLRWQYQWNGMLLQNLRILVCTRTCLDRPQIQLKTIILPPDPLPVFNPRPELYDVVEPSNLITMSGIKIVTMSGVDIVMMSNVTPSPDPDDPVLFPPDF